MPERTLIPIRQGNKVIDATIANANSKPRILTGVIYISMGGLDIR